MSKLSFEDWLELNEAELLIEFAESGADRELDFDSEREIEERYDTYCREVDRELTQTIWKFPIDIKDISVIKMPEATQILTVQIDESTGRVCMWGLATPGKFVDRTFQIFGTGHTINIKAKKRYIGTFQNSGFVGHVFEIFKSKNHEI